MDDPGYFNFCTIYHMGIYNGQLVYYAWEIEGMKEFLLELDELDDNIKNDPEEFYKEF